MLLAVMKVLAVALHLSACSAAASCTDAGACVLGSDETSLLQVKSVLEPGIERVLLSSSVGCPAECSERAAAEGGVWRIPCKSMRMKQCQVCDECVGVQTGVGFAGTSGVERGDSSCPTNLGLYPIPSGKNPLWFNFAEYVIDRQANPHAVDEFCGTTNRHLVRHELRYCCSSALPSPEDLREQACRVLATAGSGLDRGGAPTMMGKIQRSRTMLNEYVPLLDCGETIEERFGEGSADDKNHVPSAPEEEVDKWAPLGPKLPAIPAAKAKLVKGKLVFPEGWFPGKSERMGRTDSFNAAGADEAVGRADKLRHELEEEAARAGSSGAGAAYLEPGAQCRFHTPGLPGNPESCHGITSRTTGTDWKNRIVKCDNYYYKSKPFGTMKPCSQKREGREFLCGHSYGLSGIGLGAKCPAGSVGQRDR